MQASTIRHCTHRPLPLPFPKRNHQATALPLNRRTPSGKHNPPPTPRATNTPITAACLCQPALPSARQSHKPSAQASLPDPAGSDSQTPKTRTIFRRSAAFRPARPRLRTEPQGDRPHTQQPQAAPCPLAIPYGEPKMLQQPCIPDRHGPLCLLAIPYGELAPLQRKQTRRA